MQRKKYYQWIAIASSAILVVVILFIMVLRAQKSRTDSSAPSSTPTPSSPATITPLPEPSPSATSSSPASPTTQPTTTVDHKAKAEAAYKNKNYPEAISEYLLAIDSTSNTAVLSTYWNELGNVYRDNQSHAEAIKAYDTAISLNAQLGDPYLNKAALLWAQGKKDEARTTLKAGINAGASRQSDLQNTLSVYEIEA